MSTLIASEIEFHVAKLAQVSSNLKDDWVAIIDFSIDILRYLLNKILNDKSEFYTESSLPSSFLTDSFRWFFWLLINVGVVGWLGFSLWILVTSTIEHSIVRIFAALFSLVIPPLVQRMIRVRAK